MTTGQQLFSTYSCFNSVFQSYQCNSTEALYKHQVVKICNMVYSGAQATVVFLMKVTAMRSFLVLHSYFGCLCDSCVTWLMFEFLLRSWKYWCSLSHVSSNHFYYKGLYSLYQTILQWNITKNFFTAFVSETGCTWFDRRSVSFWPWMQSMQTPC